LNAFKNKNYNDMKTKQFVTFFSLLVMLLVSVNVDAQCDKNWASKTYKVGDFKEVYLEGGYKVFLIQGDENKIVVKASDEDAFDCLRVKRVAGELRLKVKQDHFDFSRVVLYITFKELEHVKIEGGVKVETKGYLDLNDFEMYVAGGAKVEMEMKADNVRITGEGGIYFELKGVAKSLDVKITGAGHVNAERLKAKNVSIKIEGVGTGSVYATETLFAKIEGVGKVSYKGHPKVTKSIDGLGSVKCND
jgi:hypothetical protein